MATAPLRSSPAEAAAARIEQLRRQLGALEALGGHTGE
jgi:hypothetical protein